jgi:hypothetical protein
MNRYRKDAWVIATGKPIPFRQGSGAHQRSADVIANSPATVENIEALPGIRKTTIGTLHRLGVIAVEGAEK